VTERAIGDRWVVTAGVKSGDRVIVEGLQFVKPGATVKAGVTVDPRLLAMYDSASRTWKVAQGDYRVTLAASAADPKATSTVVHLEAAVYDVNGKRVAGQ
jgi:beta-glucosidase